MTTINLKARALQIQRDSLIKELQRLLAQLENPNMTVEQLAQIKADLEIHQKRYESLTSAPVLNIRQSHQS